MRCVEEIVEAARPESGARPGGAAVPVRLPSGSVVALYWPDMLEHERRSARGAGAVQCPSMLSALWEMPAGIPVPVESIQPMVRDSVLAEPGLIDQSADGQVRREFEPCGAVSALFTGSRSPEVALRQASLLSPIYARSAVVSGPAKDCEWRRMIEIAQVCDIGLLALDSEGGGMISIAPPSPILGRPHVFRWWMVEMAYASWIARGEPTR